MFTEKLNKKQDGNVYIIEEEQVTTNGKYEGLLQHDNVNRESLNVFTGPKFTGDKIDNAISSIPSETPWKTYIKVYSEAETIYITYETTGDIVEADDINLLQETVNGVMEDFKDYKLRGHIDGGTF